MKPEKKPEKRIVKIPITGGPCSGKSTVISTIKQRFQNAGWKVFICQEMATRLFSSGIEIFGKGLSGMDFQEEVFLRQLDEEDFIYRMAQAHDYDNILIVLDRAIMDGMAYVEEEAFSELLHKHGYDKVQIRDLRYDAVFHLDTAAKGAEQFFTLENNEARKETIQEARILDDKTIAAYLGHSYLRRIDNSTGFDEKVDRLVQEMFSFLGMPVPEKTQRKFLVTMPNINDLDIPYQIIDIQQQYLKSSSPNEEGRIRKRGQHGSFTYYWTKKTAIEQGVYIEKNNNITHDQYRDFLSSVDPSLMPISKQRFCFMWENQYFNLDVFHEHLENLVLLEINPTNKRQNIFLPPWISIIKEVTDDTRYSNYNLAKSGNIPE